MLAGAIALLSIPQIAGQASVLTWQNDLARTGQNLQETVLTPANVNPASFGKLFVIPADGKVDAQPLYVPSVSFPGKGTRNALYVVTEHDSAYAFDADTGEQLWKVSVLPPGETPSDDRGCFQVTPEIGITATPVIDPGRGPNGTLYLVAMSKDASGSYHHRVHALDLSTGAELSGGPVEVRATYPGSGREGSGTMLTFDPKVHKSRPALTLVNGVVYTSWGSHCDQGRYTGWVIGYDANTLAQVSVLNVVPNGGEAGIWNSGAGPGVDSSGNLFISLGNGTFDTSLTPAGFPANSDFGNSIIKVSTAGANLRVTDYFTMSDTVAESDADLDLGSGGVILIPPLSGPAGQQLLAAGGGKGKVLYVLSQNDLGKFSPTSNHVVQQISTGQMFSTPAWFDGTLYFGSVGQPIQAYPFNGTTFAPAPSSRTGGSFPYPGATPAISANGNSNGILWANENRAESVLHAYDARDLSRELYNSNQAPNGRDHFGEGNKFIVPTIANGRVYVGTTSGVGVFGLLGGACTYSISPANATVSGLGESGSIAVSAPSGCAWTASSRDSWLIVDSGASGSGNGTVRYRAETNPSSNPRTGEIEVAGQVFTVNQARLPPPPVIASVNNAASLAGATAISPGEIVTLRGTGIGPSSPASFTLDASGTVDPILAGTRVLVSGAPAPILFASANQVNAIIPYEVAGRSQASIQLELQGSLSAPVSMAVAPSAPGVFTSSSSGSGQAAALNEDGSLNSGSNPARPGSYLTLYLTGGGQTDPPAATGSVSGTSLASLLLPVEVSVGSVPADVTFAGAAPGFVSGLVQVNVRLAQTTPSGPAQPVQVKIGTNAAASGVTVAIQ
jgi:uncharacterized protein (TIGR03437 family)